MEWSLKLILGLSPWSMATPAPLESLELSMWNHSESLNADDTTRNLQPLPLWLEVEPCGDGHWISPIQSGNCWQVLAVLVPFSWTPHGHKQSQTADSGAGSSSQNHCRTHTEGFTCCLERFKVLPRHPVLTILILGSISGWHMMGVIPLLMSRCPEAKPWVYNHSAMYCWSTHLALPFAGLEVEAILTACKAQPCGTDSVPGRSTSNSGCSTGSTWESFKTCE